MNNWIDIKTEQNLYDIIQKSSEKTQIIFKHSTTCGISAHAEHKLVSDTALLTENADFNYLDLLRYRTISNLIAQELGVTHQSPQIIILKDKKVVKSLSHHAIDAKKIVANI